MVTRGAKEQNTNFLAWLAGAAGVITGSAVLVSKCNIGVKGFYISCQTAAVSVTAMPYCVSASASAGIGVSIGAGIAVAAAVYFIPWKKLAVLMSKAWDHFVQLMGYLWKFLGDGELLARLIHTVVVVLHSTISGVVDDVTQSITQFISFLGKKYVNKTQ